MRPDQFGIVLRLAVRVAVLDAARVRCGLGDVAWIDPEIRPGVTPIMAIHITQLRAAIDAATQACGQMRSAWTDPRIVPGVTHVKAVHVTELRDAVLALNDGSGANQAPEPIAACGESRGSGLIPERSNSYTERPWQWARDRRRARRRRCGWRRGTFRRATNILTSSG